MTAETKAETATPSIASALKKINAMLSKESKFKVFLIGCFALLLSIMEVVTASTVVLLGESLNDPESGKAHLDKIFGFMGAEYDFTAEHALVSAAALCGVVYLIKNVIAGFEVFFHNINIQKMNYDFKSTLLARYAYADYSEYLTRNSMYNCRVVGGDADQMFSGAMVSIAIIMSEAVVFACLIGLIIYINPSLAFAIFIFGVVIAFLLAKFLLPMFYRWGARSREASMMSWQHLLQFFHGFKDIILFGKRAEFIDVYKECAYEQAQLAALQTGFKALPRLVIEVLFVAIFVFVIAFLSYTDQPIVSMVGVLGGYLYAGFRLMPGLNRIITQLNLFKGATPCIERVYEEYMHVAKPENYADVPGFTFDDQIELKAVSCAYLGTDQKALSGVNLTIKKGEHIGIIGETGSGKSTLIDTILGLLVPQEGEIKVDGQYPVSSKQWHEHIGYVPQNLYLTDNTIEENIALGVAADDIDREKLDAAVEAAQLSALLKKLPLGLKTVVGERGVRLSGGERQRVAIARALYREPDVLVFDEATSALDNATEKRLMKTINAVSENRTVIMVAHRLSTLENCDRIITLKSGTIESIKTEIS